MAKKRAWYKNIPLLVGIVVGTVIVLALLVAAFFFPRLPDTISRTEYEQSQVALKGDLRKQLAENSSNQTAVMKALKDEVTAQIAEKADKKSVEELEERIAALELELSQKDDLVGKLEELITDQGTQLTEISKYLQDVLARLSYTPTYPSYYPPSTPPYYGSQNFIAEVYDGENFERGIGSFSEPTIDHDWGNGGPLGLTNHFSVVWGGNVWFEGDYQFRVRVDDGVRLYIDGYLVIDKWLTHAVTPYYAERYLTQGYHNIRLEYFEREGQAVVRLDWQKKYY